MKKTILRILSYILVAAVAAVTAVFCCQSGGVTSGKLDWVRNLVDRCYIGQADLDAMEDAAAGAMINAIGDRWSYYMTAEEYLEYQDLMANSYVGVGITIQMEEDGSVDVMEVLPGSGAEEAGIQPGDRITAVDGTSILGMTSEENSALIKGEENTTVRLTLIRGGQTLEVDVVRRRVETPVATYKMLEDNIGLVTIENFDLRCAEESIAAIEALLAQGAESLIFDVRNNPGGYKTEMVELLDYLLPEGVLFRAEDYRGVEEVDESDADCLEIPMAVVVNLNSYSAAEFFAAALSEYEAAVVVGEKTFGKGYFQNTFPLPDGSAVNLSIGKYCTPKGVSLADVGLAPDVSAPVDEETAARIYYDLLDPMEDPQILAAINALKKGNTP